MSQKAQVRDLLRDPAWQEKDVGFPLPDSSHACVVSLPTWQSVIGYEESDASIVARMRAGYPRFFIHPITTRYFERVEARVANKNERVIAYSSEQAAGRAASYVSEQSGVTARQLSEERSHLVVPEAGYQAARDYWRHTGEIISSRQAEDLISGRNTDPGLAESQRESMARVLEVEPQDAFLLESGMAAIFTLFRIITERRPGLKTLQLCFPYVDALKVQEQFGAGVDFVNEATGEALEQALRGIRSGRYAAVFCEVPSNPLLHTVDLGAVADACHEGGVPLLVDDTVCSHLNIDTLAYADAASTSLTKWVSGVGDVLAGSIRLRKDSQFADEFREALEREVPGGSRLYHRDGDALVRNASDFQARVTECNRNGLQVASFLADQPEVSEVWYPAFTDREAYEAIRRPNGGFGGLISFTLKEADKTAALYEAMQFCKGPSLGTDYTLLCPYTMLAHYREMGWARSCGVSEALLRFSVGREPEEVILARLESAFSALR